MLTVVLHVCLQGFASKLARKHYKHALKLRAWNAWRSVIESKWKQRVEKACQVNFLVFNELCTSVSQSLCPVHVFQVKSSLFRQGSPISHRLVSKGALRKNENNSQMDCQHSLVKKKSQLSLSLQCISPS